MQMLSKIKDAFKNFFQLPPLELSKEEEDEIVEKLAGTLSQYGMEELGQIFGWMLYPVSTLFSASVMLPLSVLLSFFGIDTYKYAAFLYKKENVKRLLDRLEELEDRRQIKK